MRVVVVGAGAVGGFYGALLARASHQVGFLARGEHLEAMRRRGLEVRSAELGTFTVHAAASDAAADLGPADLVLFTVKTYDLQAAAEQARLVLAPGGSLITFQNGFDAPDQLAAIVGREQVLIGTTGLEATMVEPGVIGHLSNFHFVTVAALDGPPTPRVRLIVESLVGAGIHASAAEDGRRTLWEKAWLLVPMATITSVCRASVGPIRDLPETRSLAFALIDELGAVARAYGYDLPEAAARARTVLETWPATAKASMARDFERGSRTELEALTGALVRMAAARGVDVPVHRTAYALLKLRQQMQSSPAEKAVGTAADGR